MRLPEIHNQRFRQQVKALNYDFYDKSVMDVGCGYGDLMFHAVAQGASLVHGIESDMGVYISLAERISKFSADNNVFGRITVFHDNVESYIWRGTRNHYDVAFCFSVLPYLIDPISVLQWMAQTTSEFFVESQYAKDGPGFDFIENDSDFENLILRPCRIEGEVVGKTLVEGRNLYRSIWKCEGRSNGQGG